MNTHARPISSAVGCSLLLAVFILQSARAMIAETTVPIRNVVDRGGSLGIVNVSNPATPVPPDGDGIPGLAVDLVTAEAQVAPSMMPAETWLFPKAVLWDNGPLVTHPGACSGQDASRLQDSLNMITLGFGHQFSQGYRITDDFTITDPAGWIIDNITFFAYQSSAPSSPSPITGVYYQIWNGPPGDAGSSVVFGDLTTNRLLSSTFTYIQRDSEIANCSQTRYIFANVGSAGVVLPPGTYWIDWMTDGSVSYTGPWAPPITILGQTTTGNGMQYTGAWKPLVDGGTSTQQGLPFIIQGALATQHLVLPLILR